MKLYLRRIIAVTLFSLLAATLGTACNKSSSGPPPQTAAPSASSATASCNHGGMTLEQMDAIVREMASEVERNEGAWAFKVSDIPMLIITDEKANRMRVLAQVGDLAEMTAEQLEATLYANFHTALDARYAVTGGTMYSVYIHPLRELQPDQLRNAIGQVGALAVNFGTTYSSSDVFFPGSAP